MRLALSTAFIAASILLVVRAAVTGEPELISVYPFGGQQGAEFQTTVRGRSLDRVSAIWFDCDQLSATIIGVENDKSRGPAPAATKKKKKSSSSTAPPQLLILAVKVAPGAEPGVHYMRVLTPRGISNPLPLRVHTEPAISEDTGRHDLPEAAQKIPSFPVIMNGKIAATGEVDYYSFEVQQGETLRFDALSAGGALDPGLTLFEPTGSWFRPDRLTELAFNDEEVSYPGFPVNAAITYKFPRKGRYLVRVNGFLGESGSDYSYQLSIRRASTDQAQADLMRPAHLPSSTAAVVWEERSWKRELGPDRLKVLSSRAGESSVAKDVPIVRLDGPDNKGSVGPVPVTIPALLEGTIEHPADIDRVKFKVKAGDRIAIEVETVRKTVPQFNPFLRIVSTGGDEAFTNVHSTVNTCGDLILKQVQPKTIYSFPRDSEYILEIRDITHLYGDESFAYRVMLRKQVPHMGEIRVSEEQINLMAGEATKVSVDTDQEEGFDGQIALTVEGLPTGVRAVTGTELQAHVPPAYNPGKVERFRPETQRATFLFVTDRGAAPTSKPVEASIIAQPVMKGKLGHPVVVKKVLFTVVQSGLPGQKDRTEIKTPEIAE
jgi:hypothetical protein